MATNLTSSERISRVKIQLQDSHPFWAYLILKMNMQEDVKDSLPIMGVDEKGKEVRAGMGVNAKGDMFWRKEFVESLKDDELKFVLAHEVNHLIFAHMLRLGTRDMRLFNIANDIVVNNILVQNGFTAPKCGIIPYDNKVEIFGYNVIDIDKKTSEQIYDEFPADVKKKVLVNVKGFDNHEYGDELSEAEKDAVSERWKDNVIEAATYAKQRGMNPRGLEGVIGKILNPKVNWKTILRRYLVNSMPHDFTFSRPNRKIQDVILPGVVKESIDIVVHIDTSGSISSDDLSAFMGEIIGMALSHNNVNIILIQCDCAIQSVVKVNSRSAGMLRGIQIKGFGGTSHKPVFSYIKENVVGCKLLVSLTDGYSDIKECVKPSYPVLFIINRGVDTLPFGKVIKIG
jgi:predicted metal-dependent peptidase